MKRSNKGFTLIELLIVVVIIGILAAIAIPKFAATKEKAYIAAVKTDLKNLATVEEGYASSHNGTYLITGDVGPTAADSLTGFPYMPSAGVTVTLGGADGGWSATAIHASVPDLACDIYYNTTKTTNATAEGVPACNK
jgi:prepilin-type N-terminal cleavage/methylation domain-containing protein